MMAFHHLICDRCDQTVRNAGKTPSGFTTGYYKVESGYWHQFANPGEAHLCDACMFADSRYQAVYGKHSA